MTFSHMPGIILQASNGMLALWSDYMKVLSEAGQDFRRASDHQLTDQKSVCLKALLSLLVPSFERQFQTLNLPAT